MCPAAAVREARGSNPAYGSDTQVNLVVVEREADFRRRNRYSGQSMCVCRL